jgi:hypothetical protein
MIVAERQSPLAKPAANDNHPITRPPLPILIDARFSSRLSRDMQQSRQRPNEAASGGNPTGTPRGFGEMNACVTI